MPITLVARLSRLHPAAPAVFVSLFALSSAVAQTAPPATEEDSVRLSVFEVSSARDVGYQASNTVSATKTATELKNVPASISAVTAELLRDLSAAHFGDAINYSAGAVYTSTFNYNQYVIRGYINRYQMRDFFITWVPVDTYNAERVEIVRGPSALLYGRSDSGGIVNMTIKQPFFRDEAVVSARVGSYEDYRATLDINRVLTDDVAVRLNGVWHEFGSWREHEEGEYRAINPSIVWRLGERTSLRAEFERGYSRRTVYHFVPVYADAVAVTGDAALTGTLFTGLPRRERQDFWGRDTARDYDFATVSAYLRHAFSPTFSVELALQGQNDDNDQIFPALLRGVGRAVNPASGQVEDYFLQGYTQIAAQREFRNVALSFSYELDVGFSKQRLLAFLHHNREELVNRQAVPFDLATNAPLNNRVRTFFSDGSGPDNVSLQALARLQGAPGAVYRVAGGGANTDTDETNNSITLSSSGEYADGRFRTLLGARFDDYTNDYGVLGRDLQFTYGTQAFDRWSVTAGGLYALTPNLSLYGLYSESFRPNGTRFDAAGNILPPLTGESVEAGVKLDFLEGRLSGYAAAYRIRQKNEATGNPAAPGTFLGGRDTESRGIEIDLTYNPGPGWAVMANYAFAVADVTREVGFAQDIGRRQSGERKHNVNAFLRRDFVGGALAGWFVGGGFNYKSRGSFDYLPATNTNANQLVTLPSYVKVDVLAGYRRALRNNLLWTLQLNVENLFDTDYEILFPAADHAWVQLGDPLRVRLTSSFRF